MRVRKKTDDERERNIMTRGFNVGAVEPGHTHTHTHLLCITDRLCFLIHV